MIDDLARRLVPPPGEDITIRQGVIRTWNADTFEGTVEYDGLIVPSVPVASGVDATTYRPGTVVLLEGWFPGGPKGELGIGSFWIKGRAVIPGTGAAEQAISFMNTAIARNVAAAVIADRIRTEQVFGIGTRNNIAYGDLTGVDPGPVIPNVEVSAAGKMIVTLSCDMTVDIAAGRKGFMSFDLAGPTSLPANDGRAYSVGVGGDPTLSVTVSLDSSKEVVVTGLVAGTYTLTAQYRTLTTDGNVTFISPLISVIAY